MTESNTFVQNHNMYGMVEGTVYKINKALLDVYFDSQQVDFYSPDIKKFKFPKVLDVHPVTQELVYTKKEFNTQDGWMFYFQYDGIYMRFGKRFIAYLRYIKKHPLMEIDSLKTLHNLKTGQHHKDYLAAFQIALGHRAEREKLAEVNAGVLAKYFNPSSCVDPDFEWNKAGFFKKVWMILKQQIKEKTWKRQSQQFQQEQERLRLQVLTRRAAKEAKKQTQH